MNTYLQADCVKTNRSLQPDWTAQGPGKTLSQWSCSPYKRRFDIACVLLSVPLLVPVCTVVAAVVFCSAPGPVFYRQNRVGRNGKIFKIIKFRTIETSSERNQSGLTTVTNQRFTPLGRLLRKWKLDELPQMLNVLVGDMSLVGPRPKLPEFVQHELSCRPGLTGAASLAFASEETVLAKLPDRDLETFYFSVVLPAKRELDEAYMARATLFSDLRLILSSAARLWDDSYLTCLMEKVRVRRCDQEQEPGCCTSVLM